MRNNIKLGINKHHMSQEQSLWTFLFIKKLENSINMEK